MASFLSFTTTTSGNTLTAPAGSNRVLILQVSHESGDARYITGVTWNGVAVGQAGPQAREAAGSSSRGISTWIILESEIAANSGTAYSIAYNTTPTNTKVEQIWLQDAEQSYTPSATDTTDGGAGATTATRTVVVPSSGVAIALVVTNWDTGANFTWSNGTEIYDVNNSGSSTARSSAAYNATAGSQAMQVSWTDSVGYAMLAMAIADVGGASSAFIPPMRSAQYNAFASARQRFV